MNCDAHHTETLHHVAPFHPLTPHQTSMLWLSSLHTHTSTIYASSLTCNIILQKDPRIEIMINSLYSKPPTHLLHATPIKSMPLGPPQHYLKDPVMKHFLICNLDPQEDQTNRENPYNKNQNLYHQYPPCCSNDNTPPVNLHVHKHVIPIMPLIFCSIHTHRTPAHL